MRRNKGSDRGDLPSTSKRRERARECEKRVLRRQMTDGMDSCTSAWPSAWWLVCVRGVQRACRPEEGVQARLEERLPDSGGRSGVGVDAVLLGTTKCQAVRTHARLRLGASVRARAVRAWGALAMGRRRMISEEGGWKASR